MVVTWFTTLFNTGWNFMSCSFPIWPGVTFKSFFMFMCLVSLGLIVLAKLVGGSLLNFIPQSSHVITKSTVNGKTTVTDVKTRSRRKLF